MKSPRILGHLLKMLYDRVGLVRVLAILLSLESVPKSELGATTDVRQAAGYDFWLAAVLTLSAKTCRSRIHKNSELWEIIIGGNRLLQAKQPTCTSDRTVISTAML